MKIFYQNRPLFLLVSPDAELPGTIVDAPGGKAIQAPDGSYLSVQPDGTFQTRPAVGPWETFQFDGTANLFRTNSDGVTYVVSYRAQG